MISDSAMHGNHSSLATRSDTDGNFLFKRPYIWESKASTLFLIGESPPNNIDVPWITLLALNEKHDQSKRNKHDQSETEPKLFNWHIAPYQLFV